MPGELKQSISNIALRVVNPAQALLVRSLRHLNIKNIII